MEKIIVSALTVPNKDIRRYAVKLEVEKLCSGKEVEIITKEIFPIEVGRLEKQFIKEMMSVSGVYKVFAEPYEVRVEKERGARWEDIEPKIIKILETLRLVTFKLGI